MGEFKFTFNEKIYALGKDNCDYILNDEEVPVSGFELDDLLELLNQTKEVGFEQQYYDQPCKNCLAGKAERSKYFRFLEYHFFIFTKDQQYKLSSISRDRTMSYNQMERQKVVDDSYFVSVMVCENCGHYSVEIEECEV